MTRLILLRHGETDYNSCGRYCGFSDPPLNEKGIWQAERLADRLKDMEIDKVYSSDLKRSVQTAEIVFKSSPIARIKDLREMNFAVFEGLKYEEIVKQYGGFYSAWIDDPVKTRIPHGENLGELRERVGRRVARILSMHEGGNVAVITHGGPIRIMLCEALNLGPEMFWQIKQEPGAFNLIEYAGTSLPAVVSMNDISHLLTGEEVVL